MYLWTGRTCVPGPCLPTAQTAVSQPAVLTRTIHLSLPACLSELLRCPCKQKYPESTASLLLHVALVNRLVTCSCSCWLALMRLFKPRLELCSQLFTSDVTQLACSLSDKIEQTGWFMINHTGHVTIQTKHIHDASILLKRASNRGAPLWIQPAYISLHNVRTLLQMLKGVTRASCACMAYVPLK